MVMKTGSHPIRTRLLLFLDWGITFGEPYQMPEHGQRRVYYAGRQELRDTIIARSWTAPEEEKKTVPRRGDGFVRKTMDMVSRIVQQISRWKPFPGNRMLRH